VRQAWASWVPGQAAPAMLRAAAASPIAQAFQRGQRASEVAGREAAGGHRQSTSSGGCGGAAFLRSETAAEQVCGEGETQKIELQFMKSNGMRLGIPKNKL
jgi:hypothetical protein